MRVLSGLLLMGPQTTTHDAHGDLCDRRRHSHRILSTSDIERPIILLAVLSIELDFSYVWFQIFLEEEMRNSRGYSLNTTLRDGILLKNSLHLIPSLFVPGSPICSTKCTKVI